jgi:hypothetical protein
MTASALHDARSRLSAPIVQCPTSRQLVVVLVDDDVGHHQAQTGTTTATDAQLGRAESALLWTTEAGAAADALMVA